MVTSECATKLAKLRRAEFGSLPESVLRYSLLAMTAGVLWNATSDVFYLIWLAAYLMAEAALAAWLHIRSKRAYRERYFVAVLLFNLSTLAIISAPISMVATADPTLVIVGSFALVALLLYDFQRLDGDPAIVYSGAAQFFFVVAVILYLFVPKIEDISGKVTIVVASLALIVFYISALRSQLCKAQALRQSQIRYAQSQKARAMTQFVSGVAHDFNNMLTAIIGNLDLHGALHTEEEQRKVLNEARGAAERAAMTVRQLLATSGRSRLRPAPIEAIDLHKTMVEMLCNLLDKGIDLQSEAEDPDFHVFADRSQLETVLVQLCLNAQDAMGGQGTIWMRSHAVTTRPDVPNPPHAPPPYFCIIVEDNGPGVTEEALPLLAEPFFSTKAPGLGPGLGLSAVQGFAKQSGGTLILENRVSGGLRAKLLMPRA